MIVAAGVHTTHESPRPLTGSNAAQGNSNCLVTAHTSIVDVDHCLVRNAAISTLFQDAADALQTGLRAGGVPIKCVRGKIPERIFEEVEADTIRGSIDNGIYNDSRRQ